MSVVTSVIGKQDESGVNSLLLVDVSLKKKLFGESLVYGIARYASFVAAIFLTPIYTRLLTKADYGIMDVFNKWNAFALAILPLGLFSSLIRFYPEIQDKVDARKRHLGSLFVTLLFLCLIYLILMLLIQPVFLELFVDRAFENINAIYVFSIGIVICQVLFHFCLQILRVNHKSLQYGLLSLLNFAILSSLGFYFIYFSGENIIGFFRASLIAAVVAVIAACFVVRNNLFLHFHTPTTKKMLRYGMHFLSVFFLFQITDLVDRYLIKEHYGLEEVGIYSIGTRIAGFILLATGALSLAWMPRAIEIDEDKDADRIYRRMFNGYVIAGFMMVAFIIIFRHELLRIFAPDYLAAGEIIAILAVFNFLTGFVYVFTIGIQLSKKSWAISISAGIAVIVKVILSILLVERFGIEGIATASLIEVLIWIAIQHYFSQKFRRIPFNYYILLFILLFYPLTMLTQAIEESERYQISMKLIFFGLLSFIAFYFFRKLAYRYAS